MTKDEKSGASEAGHDANALEDLPAQQFSLESWIVSGFVTVRFWPTAEGYLTFETNDSFA